jgi:hypothetical protein
LIRDIVPFMGDMSCRYQDFMILLGTPRISVDIREEFYYDSMFGFLAKKPKHILFQFEDIPVSSGIVRTRLNYDDTYREIFKANPMQPRISYLFVFGHNVPPTYGENFLLRAIGFNTLEDMLLFKLSTDCKLKPISLEDFDKFTNFVCE